MGRIVGSSILISALFIAGCASSGAARSGERAYDVELESLMSMLETTLANMAIEVVDLSKADDDTYSLVARQVSAAARSGGTNTNPNMQSLQIQVRRTSPATSSVRISIPPANYGAVSGAQLRQRVLNSLDRRVESSR